MTAARFAQLLPPYYMLKGGPSSRREFIVFYSPGVLCVCGSDMCVSLIGYIVLFI